MSKRFLIGGALVASLVFVAVAIAAGAFNQVKPGVFDPAHTNLVQSGWLSGIGCPTGAKVATYPATSPTGTFTSGGCPTGDPNDKGNEGLLLAKTGPTPNNASAFAVLKNVKGITLTELGYDLRKPGANQNDPRGSHCGNGAPRFNITTSDGFWFNGCNSPPPTVTSNTGDGWMRLRWSPVTGFFGPCGPCAVTGTVKEISIVLDEGQDTGPDNFGLAVLDNIDVNGTLVGQGAGPQNANDNDNDDNDNDDNDGDNDHHDHHHHDHHDN